MVQNAPPKQCAVCGDINVEEYGCCDGLSFCSDACMESYLHRDAEDEETDWRDLPLEPEDSDLMREW